MARKIKNKQQKIFKEMEKQLMIQAERWGVKDNYTPLKIEEMKLEAIYKLRTDFLSEKNNLEYEMNMLGTNKKEVLIKIEKINIYLSRIDRLIERYNQNISKIVDKNMGDRRTVERAKSVVEVKPRISVLVG